MSTGGYQACFPAKDRFDNLLVFSFLNSFHTFIQNLDRFAKQDCFAEQDSYPEPFQNRFIHKPTQPKHAQQEIVIEPLFNIFRMKIVLLLNICISFFLYSNAQHRIPFCRAVENGNFKKVERLVKKESRKVKRGIAFDNGPGSRMQVSLMEGLDSLTAWLSGMSCVEDAFWDKCETKIGIYPGWSVIGVRFRVDGKIQEKCFHFQEGTTGTINIFGWRPRISRMRNLLIYKRMYDCPGFIVRQRESCSGNR